MTETKGKEPFFSICIPNFNYALYVGITIQSVLDQTFGDFEVILVDNASTDNSLEVMNSYKEKDSRIKVFSNRFNVGFAPNLQKATELAKGKYIILLSSDDVMYPEALQVYHDLILSNGPGTVIHSAHDIIDSAGKVTQIVIRDPATSGYAGVYRNPDNSKEAYNGSVHTAPGNDVLRESILKAVSPATFCTTCYPRALWEKVEGYDLKYIYGPDTAFLYRLLAFNPKFIYVGKRLFGYRIHESNQSSQNLAAGALKQQSDKYIQCI